jgi:hypothetical protein
MKYETRPDFSTYRRNESDKGRARKYGPLQGQLQHHTCSFLQRHRCPCRHFRSPRCISTCSSKLRVHPSNPRRITTTQRTRHLTRLWRQHLQQPLGQQRRSSIHQQHQHSPTSLPESVRSRRQRRTTRRRWGRISSHLEWTACSTRLRELSNTVGSKRDILDTRRSRRPHYL